MTRLSAASLRTDDVRLRGYTYDRSTVTPGIVHLGIGAFHRAHMAVYVDDILGQDPSWGIVGASLRRPDTREALAPQDFLYTLAVRDAAGTACRVVGSLLDVLDASTQRRQLLDVMADPRIRIVSLTVTEKGYCHDPATGELDPGHPDIVHDLAHPADPVSAPGLIVAALARRRAEGVAPFAVMSCDNLPANGATTRRIVTRLAALQDPALAAYVTEKVAFPGTMVDRIVPATTDADRAAIRDITGLEDAWPIVTEPFTQWVIEDRFPQGRPAFEAVGAQLVDDVEPYELMKLRMLNGSHSTLAYLGYLAGHQYVADAIADPAFRRLVNGLMTDEVIPTLPMPRLDLEAYRDRLLERFANPALQHRTWQIAMDGSQKLPQRLLGTIRDRLAAGQGIDRLALGVAAWMRYVTGIDETGNPIEVRDPHAARLRAIADAAGRNAGKLADGLLAVTEIFGTDLPVDARFREAIIGHLQSLFDRGASATSADLKMVEAGDHGATAIGLFVLADDYLNSAQAVVHGMVRANSGPVRLLALHACELYLKAYLRHSGSTHASMRKLGHNLAAHADLAMERGLSLDKARYNDLRVVTDINDYVRARYSAGSEAGPFSSTGASVRLTEAVREQVRTALGLNDLGMPESS